VVVVVAAAFPPQAVAMVAAVAVVVLRIRQTRWQRDWRPCESRGIGLLEG
jgi:hypothetical protein